MDSNPSVCVLNFISKFLLNSVSALNEKAGILILKKEPGNQNRPTCYFADTNFSCLIDAINQGVTEGLWKILFGTQCLIVQISTYLGGVCRPCVKL